jgi:arsenate reductase (glutaredoxin)
MITLYGIKNCDTVKKARQWLDKHAIAYHFHDFRTDGLTHEQLQHFLTHCDWQIVLNRRSTTWKALTEIQKTELNGQSVINLLLEHTTLIKRPVLETSDKILVGFNADDYQSALLPKIESI